jgi:3-deoxy-manno-octulosonate cytidylyltransferase (CMP-KDO synthetase)
MLLIIIPARYASTRFPGKPLAMIGDKTMIQRVYEQAQASSLADQVVVATDDARIYDHVVVFGGKVVMTAHHHLSGTDRCAEVAGLFPTAEWVVNVQGDEPFIQAEQIDLLCRTLTAAKGGIATLAKKITQEQLLFDTNCVKVVCSQQGEALYFSRHPIPFIRGVEQAEWLTKSLHFKHIGLYGFRREILLELAELPPAPLELAESLEQLRWLDHGYRIAVGITELETVGIDTPEDLLNINNAL